MSNDPLLCCQPHICAPAMFTGLDCNSDRVPFIGGTCVASKFVHTRNMLIIVRLQQQQQYFSFAANAILSAVHKVWYLTLGIG